MSTYSTTLKFGLYLIIIFVVALIFSNFAKDLPEDYEVLGCSVQTDANAGCVDESTDFGADEYFWEGCPTDPELNVQSCEVENKRICLNKKIETRHSSEETDTVKKLRDKTNGIVYRGSQTIDGKRYQANIYKLTDICTEYCYICFFEEDLSIDEKYCGSIGSIIKFKKEYKVKSLELKTIEEMGEEVDIWFSEIEIADKNPCYDETYSINTPFYDEYCESNLCCERPRKENRPYNLNFYCEKKNENCCGTSLINKNCNTNTRQCIKTIPGIDPCLNSNEFTQHLSELDDYCLEGNYCCQK